MLYIPLSLQAAELGSAGHASPPAWTLPIVEVIGAAGQEREAQTGKEAEVRGGTTAVDKSRRRKLKEVQPVVPFGLYRATEHIKATVLDHSVHRCTCVLQQLELVESMKSQDSKE